jgi:hypothetical protein
MVMLSSVATPGGRVSFAAYARRMAVGEGR